MRQRGARQLTVPPVAVIHNESHSMQTERGGGPQVILTIGHSTRSMAEFVRLLEAHGVCGLIDVRTIPRSRHNPQFNRDELSAALRRAGDSLSPLARPRRTAPRQT